MKQVLQTWPRSLGGMGRGRHGGRRGWREAGVEGGGGGGWVGGGAADQRASVSPHTVTLTHVIILVRLDSFLNRLVSFLSKYGYHCAVRHKRRDRRRVWVGGEGGV